MMKNKILTAGQKAWLQHKKDNPQSFKNEYLGEPIHHVKCHVCNEWCEAAEKSDRLPICSKKCYDTFNKQFN